MSKNLISRLNAATSATVTAAASRLKLVESDLEPKTNNSILNDLFGRHHSYLRVSLTERCNLRCKKSLIQENLFK